MFAHYLNGTNGLKIYPIDYSELNTSWIHFLEFILNRMMLMNTMPKTPTQLETAQLETTQAETQITCADGYVLAATAYAPKDKSLLKGAIMIGPATGIKRQFYSHFASHLASNGYGVICFDNRGIGGSRSGSHKDSDATLQCWGEKDMPAVFEHLKVTFPNTHYHLIGHSAGGQLVGLMNNAMDLTSMFNVACSSGQLSNMTPINKVRAHFFMNVFIPISNTLFGHTKSQWFGMGEPLPKAVARQWQEWCNGEGYVKTAFGKSIKTHLYDELSFPSMWINADDDDIAINENVADMISVFPKMEAKTLTLTASEHGLAEIGHMKFFSRKSQVLWQHAVIWLAKQTDSAQQTQPAQSAQKAQSAH